MELPGSCAPFQNFDFGLRRKYSVFVLVLSGVLLLCPSVTAQSADEQRWADDMNKAALALAQFRGKECKPILQDAISTGEKIGTAHYLFALLKLSYCLREVGELDLAESYIARARKLLDEPSQPTESFEFFKIFLDRQLTTIARQQHKDDDAAKFEAESQKHETLYDRVRREHPGYYGDVVSSVQQRWTKESHSGSNMVVVRFGITDNGAIKCLHISNSSGDEATDKAALNTVISIGEFPPPPASSAVPIYFSIPLTQKAETWAEAELRLKAQMNKMRTDSNVPLLTRINTFSEYGMLCVNKGDCVEGESYFVKALEQAENLPSKQPMAKIYWFLSISKEHQKKYSEADEYLSKAITVVQSQLPEGRDFYITLLKARANILSLTGQTEQLINCANQIKAITEQKSSE